MKVATDSVVSRDAIGGRIEKLLGITECESLDAERKDGLLPLHEPGLEFAVKDEVWRSSERQSPRGVFLAPRESLNCRLEGGRQSPPARQRGRGFDRR